MQRLSRLQSHVKDVKPSGIYLQQHPSICGVGYHTHWQRIHIDFAGPFRQKMFFVLVDSHSKWAEVVEIKSTTSAATIKVLRQFFTTYG